jgi:hypothetical protein
MPESCGNAVREHQGAAGTGVIHVAHNKGFRLLPEVLIRRFFISTVFGFYPTGRALTHGVALTCSQYTEFYDTRFYL